MNLPTCTMSRKTKVEESKVEGLKLPKLPASAVPGLSSLEAGGCDRVSLRHQSSLSHHGMLDLLDVCVRAVPQQRLLNSKASDGP